MRAAVTVVMALALLVPLLGDYYIHVFALVLINVILAASLRPSLNCGQLNIGHSARCWPPPSVSSWAIRRSGCVASTSRW